MKSRYGRIDQLADEASVAVLCELLGVARSGYYAWRRSEPGRRAQANEALMQQIEQVFEQSRRTYGSPRVTAELRQQGHRCNHKRVERHESLGNCFDNAAMESFWSTLKSEGLLESEPRCGSACLTTLKRFTTGRGSTALWAIDHLWTSNNKPSK